MVELEIKNSVSIVRIHDDYCQSATERHLTNLNQIVSDAYKRRQMEQIQCVAQPRQATAS